MKLIDLLREPMNSISLAILVALLALLRQKYLSDRNRKKDLEEKLDDQLKNSLLGLMVELERAKEYWFLIVSSHYFEKYNRFIRIITMKENRSMTASYSNFANSNSDRFESYRRQLIEITADIRRQIVTITSIDKDLGNNLNSIIGQLGLSGSKIDEKLVRISEKNIRKGLGFSQVSRILFKKLNEPGQFMSLVDRLIKNIRTNLNQFESINKRS